MILHLWVILVQSVVPIMSSARCLGTCAGKYPLPKYVCLFLSYQTVEEQVSNKCVVLRKYSAHFSKSLE